MNKQKIETALRGTKTAIIAYRERQMIDRFTCIDSERKTRLFRPWIASGLLYGYLDRFNVKAIPIDDILQVEV